MDTASISAIAALTGTTIGGLTSLAASWLGQRVQFKAAQLAQDVARRRDLYKDFIDEAARLYVDAYEHDKAEIANLVRVYALINRMRILSSPRIVESADTVVRVIIQTYLAPKRAFRDVLEILDHEAMNPLREFSNACREELQDYEARP
jgi:hypothetical protein